MKITLREWQRVAINQYLASLELGVTSSLWEATPGSGKTRAALCVAIHQLKKRDASRILVVVPTAHLKLQWAKAAHEIGVELDPSFGLKRKTLARGFHGAVVTYQQIGSNPDSVKELAKKSVIILDEIHHAADGLRWGVALREAIDSANYILCLSGTAFRSDNNTIPFVEYDHNGLSKPQHTYSYAHAVNDGVCRPTAFLTYGGEVSWSDGENEYSASFADQLDSTLSARRLRSALDANSGWVSPMLKDADSRLTQLRLSQPDAGGLIVASDQDHARGLAQLLTLETGIKPVVVLSDDLRASKKIKDFVESKAPWLIACNMVSEGVDIPRLRVGVYATTVKTRMYFRQFLGRIVRRTQTPSGIQVAYCYLPADPRLRFLAEEIERETIHCISKNSERNSDASDLDGRPKKADSLEAAAKEWQALEGSNSGVDSVIFGGVQTEISGSNQESVDITITKKVEERLSLSEEIAEVSVKIKQLVAIYHRKTRKPHAHIHSELNKTQRVQSQAQCSVIQLKERVEILKRVSY